MHTLSFQKRIFLFLLSFILTLAFPPQLLADSGKLLESPYAPQIEPARFTTIITNPYFSLPVGKKITFQAKTEEGNERVEIQILPETKTVMGVETITYWDRVWLNDVLVEETRDYLAQDSEGNVWYFGEVVDNYADGKLIDHEGSWLAGEQGALPGIWFPAKPQVGDAYRQEYLKDEAEDITEIVALNQVVKTEKATYKDCVKTYDWTPLDKESKENKYYCPEVAGLVISDHIVKGTHTELIAVSQETPKPPMPQETTAPQKSEQQKTFQLLLSVVISVVGVVFIWKKFFEIRK